MIATVAPASGVPSRLPVAASRASLLHAAIGHLDGFDERPVACFRGEVTSDDAAVVVDLIHRGIQNGVPIVGIVEGMGITGGTSTEATPHDGATPGGAVSNTPALGFGMLDGWGAIARALTKASGVVPTALVLDGPCLGAAALAVGLVDVVVMTHRGALLLNRPEASIRMTGAQAVDPSRLGGPRAHLASSGIADAVADDLVDAMEILGDVLSHLPPNNMELPPAASPYDPHDRSSAAAADVVPTDGHASYDVRDVVRELVDGSGFAELRPAFGTSLVVGLARIAGQPVGIVASQPSQLAGALDIESSQKGARFVRWCDAFNVPLVTLIDAPGFRPGRDQEWRGIVRHGAKLAFAYAEATVPRVSLVLRKAYGGAYIVMDCKAMGNDCALAWPQAEIAVMGAAGAIEILHGRALRQLPDGGDPAQRTKLEQAYADEHLSPRIAADRGFIDEVIDRHATRRVIAEALAALVAKREPAHERRHDNIPL